MTRARVAPLALVLLTALTGACGDDPAPAGLADALADAAPADADADDISADTASPLGPLARVYPINPLESPETVEVSLAHLTHPDGALVGDFARVRNCVPDVEAGQKIPVDLGGFQLELTACVPTHTALPGDDGTYRHIAPPESPAEDDGRFAEVMMYHHMQLIHDYYRDVHGLTDRDHPLEAIVNIQAHVDLCDQWTMLPNAAFFPEESLDQLPFGIALELDLDGDAIVFSGSATRNFAYDATVIYHEYTHAILGNTRLNAVFLDDQGLNNLPGALNEAYADYFAATLIDSSTVGAYSLNDLGEFSVCGVPLGAGGNLARDLDNDHRCPHDLTSSVHADSQMFSSALWEIRAALGPEDADRVVLAAVLTLTQTSGFTDAAQATIDAALELLGPSAEAVAQAAFDAHAVIDCPRVLPVGRVGRRGLPVSLPSADEVGGAAAFGGAVPGYLQYQLDVPDGHAEVVLTLELSAGGLFGLGGGPVELEAAFKRGADPVRYSTSGLGAVSHDAEVVVPFDASANTITLSGACVGAGPLTFALHNRGAAVSLNRVLVASSATTTTEPNFDRCPD